MRIELQAEVDGRRDELFALVSTVDGLRRWLDDAEAEEVRVGSTLHLRLADAWALARVTALDPPQHLGLAWSWRRDPPDPHGVVAFDLINHGARTHMTLRHTGLRDDADVELHDAVWRHWFARLEHAARDLSRTHG